MGVFQAAQSQGEMNVYLARRHIYTLVNCATVPFQVSQLPKDRWEV